MLDMKKTWFISDLHLDPSRPGHFKLFEKFIHRIQGEADALYILGDLFEFWIGDDIIDLPAGKPFLPIINQLKELSDSGVNIFFVQGNRDFLVQDRFMQAAGATLLPDHSVVNLYGKRVLIMHGDTLCTDDRAYQVMRALFRMKLVQTLYLMLSPQRRSKKADSVRGKTQEITKNKNTMILDVNQQAVEKVMRENDVSLLIHGHTHRPAVHQFDLDGKPVKRMVLGDWGEKDSFVECGPEACELHF